MQKQLLLPALLALSVGLAACSSQPNINLEQARSNYSALQADARSNTLAPLETEEANKRLSAADGAYRDHESEEKVDQLAYLANQSTNLAVQTIRQRDAEARLKEASSHRAKALLQARDAQLSARDQKISQLEEKLQATQTERGTLVTFGDVLFDLDRAELKPGGMQNVQTLAGFLQENPERQVIVEGYTDSSGSASHNQDLSERRANSVRTALVKMGVSPQRIVTQGYGKSYPVSSNATAAGRAMNRRVEVTISNDAKPVAPRSSQGVQ